MLNTASQLHRTGPDQLVQDPRKAMCLDETTSNHTSQSQLQSDILMWMIGFGCLHSPPPPPPAISSDREIGIHCQYTGILKFMVYHITYLGSEYSKSVFSASLGIGMQIRNPYRISCTHNKSQPTKSFVWQNIDACVIDCNVPAIDPLLSEAYDFDALHYMLPAWMVGCEPLRQRVD